MLIVDPIVSMDGFAARADGSIDWFLGRRDVVDDVGWPELMPSVTACVLGATTYREFADHWPEQDPSYDVNRIEKHVVSTTLATAPWGDAAPLTIHRDGAARALEDVTSSTSGDVVVWGSLSLCRELFALGLVDELWLRVVPVSIGHGIGMLPRRDLTYDVLDSRHEDGGLLKLRYRVTSGG